MKRFLAIFFLYFTYITCTGAFIDILRDGGARQQGIDNNVTASWFWFQFPKIWLAATAVFAFYGFYKSKEVRGAVSRVFLVLFALMFLSAFWSKYPGTALFLTLEVFVCYILILVCVFILGFWGYLKITSWFLALLLVCSAISSILVPSYGISVNADSIGAWQGVFFHKNVLGAISLLSFFVFGTLLSRQFNLIRTVFLLLAGFLVWQSESSTSIAGLLVAVSYYVLAILLKVKNGRLLGFSIVIAFCYLSAYLFGNLSNFGGQEIPFIGKDTTFSGRVVIWAYVLNKVFESPWTGYGMGQLAIDNNRGGSDFVNNVGLLVSSAHNGVLDFLYSLGIFGLMLFVYMVVLYIININKFDHRSAALFLLLYLSSSIFEAHLVGFNIFFIFFMYYYTAGAVNRDSDGT